VQQRTLIESLLRDCGDDRVVEALESSHEGLFVKNLENVQGDERDVIFFSTAFSVDRHGRLPLNFGPLNRQGGERRLNVAVTRARRQVVVFSSFDPDQLRSEETSSRGVKDLRTYLDLADSGPGVLTSLVGRPSRPSVVDRHREQVAEALRVRGLLVTTDVGLSDFKIDLSVALPANPGRPRLAVLLDGPGWARRGTVGDRDGLPVEVLSKLMRWPAVERVWLPAWLRDPDLVATRLVEAATRDPAPADSVTGPGGRAEDGGGQTSPEEDDPETRPENDHAVGEDDVETGTEGDRAEWAAVFQPFGPRRVGARLVLDHLPAERSVAVVRAVVSEVVAAEGPVHAQRLARLVARSFELSRLVESRTRTILQTVPDELWDDTGEPFAWPSGLDRASWRTYRTQQDAAERPLEHICLQEIGNAMEALAQEAAGMSEDDLLSETNRAFGGSRLTPAARERLTTAKDRVLRSGRLRAGPDGILS
jgi:hypothetical protein